MSEEIAPSDLANRENTMGHSHSQTSLEIRKLDIRNLNLSIRPSFSMQELSRTIVPDDCIAWSMPKPPVSVCRDRLKRFVRFITNI